MEDIFNNPTFLAILGIGGLVIPWILVLIFKKTVPEPKTRQWIATGIAIALYVVAFFISGVYKGWTVTGDTAQSILNWLLGIAGIVVNVGLWKLYHAAAIKLLPESWRKEE